MKRCPYCAEEIQDEAIFCRFCAKELKGNPQEMKWYFKTPLIAAVFLCVGPLVLPLIWLHPRFSRKTKTVVTLIIVIVSWYLGGLMLNSLNSIKQYYDLLLQTIEH